MITDQSEAREVTASPDWQSEYWNLVTVANALEAQVDRLRAERKELQTRVAKLTEGLPTVRDWKSAQAEVEQLKVELAKVKGEVHPECPSTTNPGE